MRLAVLVVATMFSTVAAAEAPPPSNTIVKYIHPEHFTDAEDRGFGGPASPRVLAELTSVLQDLGSKYLGADQQLTLDITDVDLAGYFEPGPNGSEPIRVLRESDWPHLTLHYSLSDKSGAPVQGDAQISDMNYLRGGLGGTSSGESLYYEQRMLDSWFAKTFAKKSGDTTAQ